MALNSLFKSCPKPAFFFYSTDPATFPTESEERPSPSSGLQAPDLALHHWPSLLPPSPQLFCCSHTGPIAVPKRAKTAPASGHLHLLYCEPGVLFPQKAYPHLLHAFAQMSLNKCSHSQMPHIKSFTDTPLFNLFPALFDLQYLSPSDVPCVLHVCLLSVSLS